VLKKRSISLSGHSTSVALEPEFWSALEAMAEAEGLGLSLLIGRIDRSRGHDPLASACRLAALRWARGRLGAEPVA
jgi:predicted DNA-binding ribbon-helix-helix protein